MAEPERISEFAVKNETNRARRNKRRPGIQRGNAKDKRHSSLLPSGGVQTVPVEGGVVRYLVTAVAITVGIACGSPSGGSGNTTGQSSDTTTKPAGDLCLQAKTAALDAISEIATQDAVGCGADTDCVLVEASLPCQENCTTAVLAARRSGFQQELADFASRTCPTLPSTCGIAPNCAALAGARCLNGTCHLVPIADNP